MTEPDFDLENMPKNRDEEVVRGCETIEGEGGPRGNAGGIPKLVVEPEDDCFILLEDPWTLLPAVLVIVSCAQPVIPHEVLLTGFRLCVVK